MEGREGEGRRGEVRGGEGTGFAELTSVNPLWYITKVCRYVTKVCTVVCSDGQVTSSHATRLSRCD